MFYKLASLAVASLRLLTVTILVAGTNPSYANDVSIQQREYDVINTASSNTISIDYENLADLTLVTNQYANIGVSFTGATILTQGGSLNYLHFPPRSGRNVIYDDPAYGGVINIIFDATKTGSILRVGGYITGNRDITMTAYDANDNVLGITSTGGPNYDPVGTPNKLLEITSDTSIAHVIVHDTGNNFTIDDFYFDSQQSCQIVGVPLYKQEKWANGTVEPWAGDSYGGTTTNPWRNDDDGDGKFDEDLKDGKDYDGDGRIDEDTPETIAKWGCALTSTAMVVSYYGAQQTGRTTTPREINNWLRDPNHQGYSSGNIIWPKVAEYARATGIAPQLYWYPGSSTDDGIVNGFMCNSAPIILGTNTAPYTRGHYIVATGQAGSGLWNINDPGQYHLTQLSSTSYNSLHKYSDSTRDPTALYIAIHSPIELLITDPAGRKTGYDPSTGQYVNGIVDSTYGVEVIGARDGTDAGIETLVFETGTPISGDYLIQMIGVGNGNYQADFTAYDIGSNSSEASINGMVANTTVFTVTLSYSSTIGSQITITQPPGMIFLPLISR